MRLFYDILYSRFPAPWDIGSRKELVEVVESGRIKPCKAIDLGCGTVSNCIFLAQRGFDLECFGSRASAWGSVFFLFVILGLVLGLA
jgi:hypothetical protein